MNNRFLSADTIMDLTNKINNININSFNKPFLIVINDVKKVNFDITKYNFTSLIKNFINTKELDQRWDSNKDWYLSYTRRLMRKINGISILEYGAKILLDNKNSRRCIISTYIDDDMINGFCPALSLVQFKIINNKLEMYTYWRSQEANIAFPLNTLCMFSYQRKMLNLLKNKYNTLELGKYTSFINQFTYDSFEDYDDIEKELKFKFYCSIIDGRGEIEYDKNYEQ